jgi:protein-arginine kinase activator protein McsA
MFATIDKSEYKDLLNKIMDFFIQKEEYEQCAKIRDLIIAIDNPPIPKPKRKYTKRKVKNLD